MKPTQAELTAHTGRSGRIFLVEYPTRDASNPYSGIVLPSEESQDEIVSQLLSEVPGCKQVNGPLINGILVITIDDEQDHARSYSDRAIEKKIAQVIFDAWEE